MSARSKQRKPGFWLAVVPLFIAACATTSPVPLDEAFPLGQSKEAVDEYFSKQNNDSGHWRAELLKEESQDGNLKRTYLYRWRPRRFFMWRKRGIVSYKLTFLNHTLVDREIWGPNQNSEIEPLCQKALIQNRRDEILIHC